MHRERLTYARSAWHVGSMANASAATVGCEARLHLVTERAESSRALKGSSLGFLDGGERIRFHLQLAQEVQDPRPVIPPESHWLFPFPCLLKPEDVSGFSCHCGKTPGRNDLKEKGFFLTRGSEGLVHCGACRWYVQGP